MPWLRRSFAGLSPRRSGFDPGTDICGEQDDAGTGWDNSCASTSVSPVSIVPSHQCILLIFTLLFITRGTKKSRRSLGTCKRKSAVSIRGSFRWKMLHSVSQRMFCVRDRLRLKMQLSIEGIIQRSTTRRQPFINAQRIVNEI